jgi:hypothetical protein
MPKLGIMVGARNAISKKDDDANAKNAENTQQ